MYAPRRILHDVRRHRIADPLRVPDDDWATIRRRRPTLRSDGSDDAFVSPRSYPSTGSRTERRLFRARTNALRAVTVSIASRVDYRGVSRRRRAEWARRPRDGRRARQRRADVVLRAADRLDALLRGPLGAVHLHRQGLRAGNLLLFGRSRCSNARITSAPTPHGRWRTCAGGSRRTPTIRTLPARADGRTECVGTLQEMDRHFYGWDDEEIATPEWIENERSPSSA